jgi:hypothetical protein
MLAASWSSINPCRASKSIFPPEKGVISAVAAPVKSVGLCRLIKELLLSQFCKKHMDVHKKALHFDRVCGILLRKVALRREGLFSVYVPTAKNDKKEAATAYESSDRQRKAANRSENLGFLL